jgi:hypothetical protein
MISDLGEPFPVFFKKLLVLFVSFENEAVAFFLHFVLEVLMGLDMLFLL